MKFFSLLLEPRLEITDKQFFMLIWGIPKLKYVFLIRVCTIGIYELLDGLYLTTINFETK